MVSNSLHGRYWHACKHLCTAHQAVVKLWKVWHKQKNALDCIAFYFASKYSSVSVWSTLYSSTMAAVCRAVGVYHANYEELWESGNFQRCFFWCSTLFTQFYPSLPSNNQQLLANQSATTLYSLMTRGCQGVSSQSLGLCDRGLSSLPLPLANTLIGYSSLIN